MTTKEGEKFAKENELYFMEVSANDSKQIEQLFQCIARKIVENKLFFPDTTAEKEEHRPSKSENNCVLL